MATGALSPAHHGTTASGGAAGGAGGGAGAGAGAGVSEGNRRRSEIVEMPLSDSDSMSAGSFGRGGVVEMGGAVGLGAAGSDLLAAAHIAGDVGDDFASDGSQSIASLDEMDASHELEALGRLGGSDAASGASLAGGAGVVVGAVASPAAGDGEGLASPGSHSATAPLESSRSSLATARLPLGGVAAKQFKKAAVAVAVGIGSMCESEEVQGLAHLLEHMLFMGSDHFPSEHEYSTYLSEFGGDSNAYTDAEATVFHFDVNPSHLEGAMHRMSRFFVAPLWKADATQREVQAVDSEFSGVLTSDSVRIDHLTLCHSARTGHPYRLFSWGNHKSLVADPEAAGVDVRAALLEFYHRYYCASRMSVVVQGCEPLDHLEELTRTYFGPVPNRGVPRPDFSSAGLPFDGSELPQVVRCVPIREIYTMMLQWTLPPDEDQYMEDPDGYVSHLVGHEAKGSILALLKARGWATGLMAGVGSGGYDRSSAATVFQVQCVCGSVCGSLA